MPISDFFIPKILNKIRMLNTYSEEDIDMIRYSLQAILWETEKFLIIGIVFALLHKLDYFLITLVILLSIRIHAGGYHSNSSLGCLFWTFLVFAFSIIILPLIKINTIGMYIILAFCLLATLFIAPLYHVQREFLLKKKAKKGKVISCIATLFWIIIILLFKDNKYIMPVVWIIFVQNMQLIFEYIRRKKVSNYVKKR